ncbi:hypothetical protein EJ08DRAFT_679477 [Tothia fuscella]|uniref:Uncharacterized protein n=1 Tax=Tothia fuscella TaxID=1048955 RepID=A0A9P4NQ17_9PEZI|nr:hypothetical protein EJ08DRAFT_679477 [Tothia fuscella]
MTSLCLAEAAEKRRLDVISEDEYLQVFVDHCAGVRHGKNRLCNGDAVIDDHYHYTFGADIKDDDFASEMAYWIIHDFHDRQLINKRVVHKTLKAYRADDIETFEAALKEVYEDFRPGLCSSLACLAILVPKPKILEVILKVHGDKRIRFNFHAAFDELKHEGPTASEDVRETVCVVEKSKFKSMVPLGKRFMDIHPLDFMA